MTLKIEVEVPFDMIMNDRADSYLDRALSAIGYRRSTRDTGPVTGYVTTDTSQLVTASAGMNNPVQESEYTPPTLPSVLNETSVQQAVKRERGKPSPGRARRTKEEIAEDEAADAADAMFAVDPNAKVGAPIQREPEGQAVMTAAQAETLQNPVVSGPVDSPEVEAQDKADEQAEVEANRKPEQPLTHEDLRNAMGGYVNTYGFAAAQADGPTIFLDALGAVPSGTKDSEGKDVTSWKLSIVPESKLAVAIAAWKAAVENNPFDREKVA